MLARVTTTLRASSLLLLQLAAWSAQVGHETCELFADLEDAHQELNMLQLGARAVALDDHKEPAGNSTSEDIGTGEIEGLQGQLASVQREMEEQHRLFEQLVADRAKPCMREQLGAGSSLHRAQHSTRKQKLNHSSQFADQGIPPNWKNDRMNLVPTQYPPSVTVAPKKKTWKQKKREAMYAENPHMKYGEMSTWPMPLSQKEWLLSMKKTNPERYDLVAEHMKEQAEEIREAKVVSLTVMAYILVFALAHLMQEYEISFLPEGVMVIAVGVILGFLLKWYCGARFMWDPEFRAEIAIQLLNSVFLPMLMLEAGWGVRRMDFISQLPYILNFAVLGTLISTAVIGMLIYTTGQSGLHGIESLRGSFIIASLISATDPVSTLGTYSELKVDPLLNIIVFGEAAINDAVAIVIFTILNDSWLMDQLDSPARMAFGGGFLACKTLIGSIILGAMVSAFVCLILKSVGMNRNKKLEILVVVLGGYLSFSVGEYFRVSGIICTLFNGMFMGKYAKYHLSKEGALLTSFYIKQMSTMMDAGVFLLSGICCVCLDLESADLGWLLIAFCAVARVFSTIPCGLISNWQKRHWKTGPNADMHILKPKYLFMIWHAGLRGGIAENLALQIGHWLDEIDGEGSKARVRSSVFMLVVFYTVVFGGTTKWFLEMLGIPMNCASPEDVLSKGELQHAEARIVEWVDSKILFPALVGSKVAAQNKDVVQGIDDEDILEVLHDVAHNNHRGGTLRKKGD